MLSGIHGDLSLDPSKAGSGWIRLAEDQVSIAHIQLNGTAEVYMYVINYMYEIIDHSNISNQVHKNGHNSAYDQYFFHELAPLESMHIALFSHAKTVLMTIFSHSSLGHNYTCAHALLNLVPV